METTLGRVHSGGVKSKWSLTFLAPITLAVLYLTIANK